MTESKNNINSSSDSSSDSSVVERQERTRHKNKKTQARFNGVKLREGETPLSQARISAGIYWKACGVCILAFLIGLITWRLGVFLLIVASITAIIAFLTKKFLFLALTNQRVLMRRGVIKIDTLQFRLDSLESVEVQRTLIGQFLGYASVVITGVGSRFTIIPFVSNAIEFRDILDDTLHNKETPPSKDEG